LKITALLIAAVLAACGSDGPVREPAELQDIVSPQLKAQVLWDKSAGDGGDGQKSGLRLAVEPDVILSADVSGDVFAFDPKDGRRLWRAETDARVISGPTVSGDMVLLGTRDAEVIALKRADGTPKWRVTVSSEVLAPPVGEGNVIVVRSGDGKLFGLSATDGKRLWSFDRSMQQLLLRGMSAPTVFGNTVFVGLDGGRAVALKLDSGELLWEQVVAAPSGRNDLDRIVDVDADLLITDGGVFAVSFGGELAAMSLEDGRVAWRRPIKSYSGLALVDKVLAVTDEDGVVWALDAQSGAAAWKQEALKYRGLSPPAAVNGYIVVADMEGYLHWLSPQDGRIVARVRALSEPVITAPVVRDHLLYVLDTQGGIAAVETESVKSKE
jgi:outer membrane protein assembly factor BamB